MRIIDTTYRYKAPIEHVYKCSADVELLKREMAHCDAEETSLKYNKQAPFAEGNTIYIGSGSRQNRLKIILNEPPGKLHMEVHLPKKQETMVGSAIVKWELSEKGKYTYGRLIVESEKEPKGLMKFLVWFAAQMFKMSSIRSMRRFRKHIEMTAC